MNRAERRRLARQGKAKKSAGGVTAAAEVRRMLEGALEYHNKGRLEQAERLYRKILKADPNNIDALHLTGAIALQKGNNEAAQTYLAKTIELKPDLALAHSNLGNALTNLGRLDEAVASCRNAIALQPGLAGAHNNLGNALYNLGQLDEAAASYRKAIASKPDLALAHNNLSNTLFGLGRLDEAIASCRNAIELKSDYAAAHSNLIYGLKLKAEPSSSEIKVEADKFGDIVRSRAKPFVNWNVRRDPAKRLRVGMVSADFKDHVISRFLGSFLGHIDQSRVELAAYSASVTEDDITERLKSHFALWRKVVGLDDRSLAGMVHDDAVDILIDLSSHTGGNRLPMFAYKPAPVQATWLGLFVTSGVPGMDYIITDPYLVPGDEAQYFSEEVWPLAESWFCLSTPDVAVEPEPLPALVNGTITFGCFNNLAKMTDVVVELWARVLLAVPGSRLFLKTRQLGDDLVRRNTLARFAAQGIGSDQLVLEGSSPYAEYFAAYNRVDVSLDPFPYAGGTTSLDSLWMAVPVLTRRGERADSHLGESIAQAAGLADWIADDDDDYVKKAADLTSDLQRLAELRAGLRERVLASSLYDGARFARHFEDALRGMWQRAC